MKQDSQSYSQELLETPSILAPGELVIGVISELNDSGSPLVDFSLNQSGSPLEALSTLSITRHHVGRSAALMFSEGDLSKPIVIGLIHSPLEELIENFELSSAGPLHEESQLESAGNEQQEAVVDGKKMVLEASEEIVLKCGESSISLHKSGKIMIRGKYLLNRATGVNRILGGSVQVN